VKPSDIEEFNNLMTKEQYDKFIGEIEKEEDDDEKRESRR
jgi:hypothetical protein